MAKRKGTGPLKWIVGAGVIVMAVAALSTLNFGDSLVYFYTPSEALAKVSDLDGQNIRIGAMVKDGSIKWDAQELDLQFVITDLKGHEIEVHHKGTPPDMFKANQGVVVEGRLENSGKTMIARTLMVKHSEEYKKPEDDGTMNKELLEHSLFKNEAAANQ